MPRVPFTSIYPDGPTDQAAAASSGINSLYPGMPVGATPISRDITIVAAGTYDLWTPSSGRRFVLEAAFISTDAAMRVAIVDESDAQGQRPVDGYFAANGGASPNMVPVPYVSVNIGNRLRVVTGGAGNVKVRVSGWEQAS